LNENKRQSRILVVDDDVGIRKTLETILETEGYIVDTAKDGSEAIEKSDQKLFDLALVDMRLPDMMGTDLLGRLKERTPKMQKIILTGYPSMQNAISSVNQGADGYILKPVDPQVILDTVKKHLQKREEEARFSEKKMVEYIETRSKEIFEQDSEANKRPMQETVG
jgi:DNA-binding NtrC family response regulator